MRAVIGSGDDGQSKLTFKHSVINEKEKKEIDYVKSQHTMGLQRSKYVVIEHSIDKIGNLLIKTPEELNEKFITKKEDIEDGQLNIRFCPDAEVVRKRKKFLKFKEGYLAKHEFMKFKAQKILLLDLVRGYIEKNIDKLYEKRKHYSIHTLEKKLGYDAKVYTKVNKLLCKSVIMEPINLQQQYRQKQKY